MPLEAGVSSVWTEALPYVFRSEMFTAHQRWFEITRTDVMSWFLVNAFFLRITLNPSTTEPAVGLIQTVNTPLGFSQEQNTLNVSISDALENECTESTTRTEALSKWRVTINLVLIVCGQIRWTERTIRAVAVEFDRLFLFLTFICVAMSSIWGAVTFVVVRWVYSGYCVYCLCLTTDGHARVRSKRFGAIIFYTVARKRISLPDECWFVESCTNTVELMHKRCFRWCVLWHET